MRPAKQLELRLPHRGGRRDGAGRKPKGVRPLVSHKSRSRFSKPMPIHVTLRMRNEVWNLRSGRSWSRLRDAFAASCGRFGMRLIQFSIQGNHVHLIVEADCHESLSRGMQGLCVRIAKALNSMMQRKGRVFADHYFSRLLETPTELVNAIRYVLENHTHHFGETGVDPYSSAALAVTERSVVLALPLGWLLRVGWRRAKQPRSGERPQLVSAPEKSARADGRCS
jgi:REP-associated tyrosine transposase